MFVQRPHAISEIEIAHNMQPNTAKTAHIILYQWFDLNVFHFKEFRNSLSPLFTRTDLPLSYCAVITHQNLAFVFTFF